MSRSPPLVFGELAARPEAADFAHAVEEVLRRYAAEIVAAHALCPHLKDVESGLGALCIGLDRELGLEAAADAVVRTGATVIHVVFPLARVAPGDFERFGSKLDEALRGRTPERLVHATFHPELAGGREDPHRLIGLLRRAPDPFVQFIPAGVQTTDGTDHPTARFERLGGATLDELLDRIETLHRARREAYASYGSAFGLGSAGAS